MYWYTHIASYFYIYQPQCLDEENNKADFSGVLEKHTCVQKNLGRMVNFRVLSLPYHPSEYLAQPQESKIGNQHHTLNF